MMLLDGFLLILVLMLTSAEPDPDLNINVDIKQIASGGKGKYDIIESMAVCDDNQGSECMDRQPYWGDCPADMHYSPGSCRDPGHKICCKENLWGCGSVYGPNNGQCYRTNTTTGGCPLPLFQHLDTIFPCPEEGQTCCNILPDRCNCDHWGYKGFCGESGWSKFCPDCAGNMQSPINLYQQNFGLRGYTNYEFSHINYDVVPESLTCQNNGHYAECYWNSAQVPVISGGNLSGTYIFEKMHWHIGCEDDAGSDHTKDGESYSGELHLIHYKATYDNFSMALDSGDQDALAVFGVFLQVNETINPVYDAITDNLIYINTGGEETTFVYNHTLSEFFPDNYIGPNFYRYYGSLTHPSCNEVVVWTVFQSPSFISNYQIRPFRCMKTGPFYGSSLPDGLPLCNNHRQIQPLNNREVTLWVILVLSEDP